MINILFFKLCINHMLHTSQQMTAKPYFVLHFCYTKEGKGIMHGSDEGSTWACVTSPISIERAKNEMGLGDFLYGIGPNNTKRYTGRSINQVCINVTMYTKYIYLI